MWTDEHRRLAVLAQRRPSARAKRSNVARATWADPTVRRKRIAGVRAASKKNRAKRSVAQRELWKNPEIRKKRTEGISRAFRSPEVLARHRVSLLAAWSGAKGRLRKKKLAKVSAFVWRHFPKPNKGELVLFGILEDLYPGQFALNSEIRKVVVGRKIPDFVHRKLPLAVELFGDFWHGTNRTGRGRQQEVKVRKQYFKKHGYTVAIIWAGELRRGRRIGSVARKMKLAFHVLRKRRLRKCV